jgi:hypothetical protein
MQAKKKKKKRKNKKDHEDFRERNRHVPQNKEKTLVERAKNQGKRNKKSPGNQKKEELGYCKPRDT